MTFGSTVLRMHKAQYKVDLHTHSIISHDGGLDEQGYTKVLASHILDVVAITDHNEISFAQKVQHRLGERIIVGEEIDALEGQIVGLFLKERVSPGLTAVKTALAVRNQKGLVYIPHPFETRRGGLPMAVIESIDDLIDVVEVYNSRTLARSKTAQALQFAKEKGFAMAASSDAHGYLGLGGSYSLMNDMPHEGNLVSLLRKAAYQKKTASVLTRLTPSYNKLRKIISHS